MKMSAEDKLNAKMYGDSDVLAILDELPLGAVTARLGGPDVSVSHHEPDGRWWRQGDPHPILADDDPAVMQAISRCAASRARGNGLPVTGSVHIEGCQWCEYPAAELLAACEWAAWSSRYVTTVIHRWKGSDSEYVRSAESHFYGNPRWQSFWALGVPERESRIRRAVLGEVADDRPERRAP